MGHPDPRSRFRVPVSGVLGASVLTPGHPRLWQGFELFFRPWLQSRLQGIHLAGLPAPASLGPGPLILSANHVSWFDGFLVREAQRHLRPRALFRALMLASELERSRMLRALGGIGFDPERPLSLRRPLRTLAGLRTAGLVVAFFPQGRIYPSFRRPLGFEPGLELLSRTLSPCTVVGLGLHLEPGNQVRSRAYVHGTTPLKVPGGQGAQVSRVEEEIHRALDHVHDHLARWGEEAWTRWPTDPGDALPGT